MADKWSVLTKNAVDQAAIVSEANEPSSLKRRRTTDEVDQDQITENLKDINHIEADVRPKKRSRTGETRSMEERTRELSSLLTFWLSPANLGKDKFLLDEMGKNKWGWIPASLFLSFRKVQALSASEADIIHALKALKPNHIETGDSHAGKKQLRIKGGLPGLKKLLRRTYRDEDQRTVYVETLPNDMSREKLIALFSKFGSVSYVSIPRFPDGRCKGFAFIEFEKENFAQETILASKNNSLSGGEFPSLRAISRTEWRENKEEYKKKKKARRAAVSNPAKPNNEPASKAEHTADGDKGQNKTENEGRDNQPDAGVASNDVSNAGGETEDTETCFEAGLIVSICGLQKAKGRVSRTALYESLEEHGPLSYIAYSPKEGDICTARYIDPSGARNAIAALAPSGGADVLGATVSAKILTGNEELEYWRGIVEHRKTHALRTKESEEIQEARRVAPRIQTRRKASLSVSKLAVHTKFQDDDS